MEYKKDLFKVVSGNSFSQLGEKKIGDPVWLGPWHLLQRKTSSKAHNVYYNKSELSTTCSITKDKGNWLNRLVKNIKLPRLYVIFSFITILLITMYCLPLLLKAMEVYL
tara:strand:+ start:1591 stop:1917 length:327 start_codon:yes stop_codon:yes gene_type:complete